MDSLTDNKVERLKVSLIKQTLDNRKYKCNPRNSDYYDLPFYGDTRLIPRRRLYRINDNVVFK